jgi:hypothetical protein
MDRDQTVYDDRLCLLTEVDIFADLSEAEMTAIAAAAPMRTLGGRADLGIIKLGRGKITMDHRRLADESTPS